MLALTELLSCCLSHRHLTRATPAGLLSGVIGPTLEDAHPRYGPPICVE